MLFLYDYFSVFKNKWKAHGVIGRFQSIEQFHYSDNPFKDYSSHEEHNMIVVKLEISNEGIH